MLRAVLDGWMVPLRVNWAWHRPDVKQWPRNPSVLQPGESIDPPWDGLGIIVKVSPIAISLACYSSIQQHYHRLFGVDSTNRELVNKRELSVSRSSRCGLGVWFVIWVTSRQLVDKAALQSADGSRDAQRSLHNKSMSFKADFIRV